MECCEFPFFSLGVWVSFKCPFRCPGRWQVDVHSIWSNLQHREADILIASLCWQLSKIFCPQHFALWNPESTVLSMQNWNLQQALFLGLSWSKSVQNRQSLPKCSPFQYYWNVFGEVFKETMEGILHFWCPLVINTDILDDVKRQVSWGTAPTTDPLEFGAQTAPVYLILRTNVIQYRNHHPNYATIQNKSLNKGKNLLLQKNKQEQIRNFFSLCRNKLG